MWSNGRTSPDLVTILVTNEDKKTQKKGKKKRKNGGGKQGVNMASWYS
jgi:hypothetical protein